MKPLTIEELKELEVGDWVWIVDLKTGEDTGYAQIEDDWVECDWDNYGKTWLAYKNKEEVKAKEPIKIPEQRIPKPGEAWMHYKGDEYIIHCISKSGDKESEQLYVTYHSPYDKEKLFTRTLEDFLGTEGLVRFEKAVNKRDA